MNAIGPLPKEPLTFSDVDRLLARAHGDDRRLDTTAAVALAELVHAESRFESHHVRHHLRRRLVGSVPMSALGFDLSRRDERLRAFEAAPSEVRLRALYPEWDQPDIGCAPPELGEGFSHTPASPEALLAGDELGRAKAAIAEAEALGLPREEGELRVKFEVLERAGVIYGFAVSSQSDYPPVTSHWGRTALFDRSMQPVATFTAQGLER